MLKKLILLTLAFMVVSQGANCADKKKKQEHGTYEMLNLFGEVMERTKAGYVEEVTDQALIEQALNGMLSSLDPHSSYMDAESFHYMSEQTKGKFGGLGIEVTMDNGLVKVVSPIDDTPAFKAGMKAGDYITHIDGETVIGLNLNEAVSRMRGKIGTKVKLSVRREGEKPFDLTITRQEIKIQSVKTDIKADDVLYVRISSFTEENDESIKKAFEDAHKKLGDKLSGIVLDVRNNPGGLLDQAVAISDLFLSEGEIVSTRSRNEQDNVKYSAHSGDITNGLPIVVLINEGSASASEIVAGALQDHHRAIVLGQKSFGKGSVQTVIPLGDFGAMRLTTARYYTPSGRSIQAKGIEPDIEVLPAQVKPLENYGFVLKEAELSGALKNEEEGGAKKDTKDKSADTKKETISDYQLTRAIDLVHALKLYQSNIVSGGKVEKVAESEKQDKK